MSLLRTNLNLFSPHRPGPTSSFAAHILAARCRQAPALVSQLREQVVIARGARWYSDKPPMGPQSQQHWPHPHPPPYPPPPQGYPPTLHPHHQHHAPLHPYDPRCMPPPSAFPPSQINQQQQSPPSADTLELSSLSPSRVPVFRSTLFVLSLSAGLVLLGAALTNLSTSSALESLRARIGSSSLVSSFGLLVPSRPITSVDLAGVRQKERDQRHALFVDSLGIDSDTSSGVDPGTVTGRLQQWIAEGGLKPASETRATIVGIVAINVAVFLAWKLPGARWSGWMRRNWMHDPTERRLHTMFTHMWSHQAFLHIWFNMYALSFGTAVMNYLWHPQRLGRRDELHFGQPDEARMLEATPRYHFLAFYISAGLFASLSSVFFARFVDLPRCYRQLRKFVQNSPWRSGRGPAKGTIFSEPTPAVQRSIAVLQGIPSLGASGAIYACVTMAALALPDARVSLLFLPFNFPIINAVACMVTFDVLGLVFAWRFFDHAAHVGGAVFGMWWMWYGVGYFDRLRLWLQKKGVGVAVERPSWEVASQRGGREGRR